jgi:OOP family OmpA-OmpF porin
MKITSGLSAIAFAVLALASTAASAEKGTGFYLGGGVGYAGHNTDCQGVEDCSKSRAGFKLLAGYQIMPNLAIEASYGDTGRTKASGNGASLSNKTDSFTIAALGIYPVTKEVELFGKLGAHSTKNKIEGSYLDVSASDSLNTSGLLAGLGAQYRFTPNVLGRVEYEYLSRAVYDLDGRKAINLLTASVLYQF